jgi:hypothetical protein
MHNAQMQGRPPPLVSAHDQQSSLLKRETGPCLRSAVTGMCEVERHISESQVKLRRRVV